VALSALRECRAPEGRSEFIAAALTPSAFMLTDTQVDSHFVDELHSKPVGEPGQKLRAKHDENSM